LDPDVEEVDRVTGLLDLCWNIGRPDAGGDALNAPATPDLGAENAIIDMQHGLQDFCSFKPSHVYSDFFRSCLAGIYHSRMVIQVESRDGRAWGGPHCKAVQTFPHDLASGEETVVFQEPKGLAHVLEADKPMSPWAVSFAKQNSANGLDFLV
jgi:hypothetical protein